MTREDLQKMYEQFIGNGKVQSLKLVQVGDNLWEWTYREGKKTSSIIDENRYFLEKMHLEFGGRNPETCRAPELFLELNSWESSDLTDRGHIITKILVKGRRVLRNESIPIALPKNSGSNQPLKSKRNIDDELDLEGLEPYSLW